ncbi:MAG: alpha/beta fold hydrolase [Pseudomonadales bacterium]|nr:alpha/beta fold hydrolase [Pseudomonadales bacterium]
MPTKNVKDRQVASEDVSSLVSALYEAVLEPNISLGLAEQADDSSAFTATSESLFDFAVVEQALPHFDHAFELAANRHIAKKGAVRPSTLFRELPLPICTISHDLTLLSTNDKARIMLHADAQLPQSAQHALAIDPLLKKDILDAVQCATSSRKSKMLNCARDSGITQTILVAPTPASTTGTSETEASAEVLFLNFESSIDEVTGALVDIYGLTPSEAQVTAYLAQGRSLDEIAEIKGSSLHTVRTQIKCAYTKTGTCRQGQLISLALNGPATWLNIIQNKDPQSRESSASKSDEKKFRLNDGRILGYGDYGPKNGKPVILCHRLIGSRKEKPADGAILHELGVRLIVPDRPGVGYSCPAEDRPLTDWADDIQQLSFHLSIDRFYVAGISAGGPYAAACAAHLSDRVIRLGLIASHIPVDELPRGAKISGLQRIVCSMARHSPAPLQKVMEFRYSSLFNHPEDSLSRFEHDGCAADKRLLQSSEVKQITLQSFEDAALLPTSVLPKQLITISRPWGFELSKIVVPTIIWHGIQDDYCSANQIAAIAKLIPNCEAYINENWGHYFLYHEWQNVLGKLVEDDG